jgi:glycopeptide antibiotics resistance protein
MEDKGRHEQSYERLAEILDKFENALNEKSEVKKKSVIMEWVKPILIGVATALILFISATSKGYIQRSNENKSDISWLITEINHRFKIIEINFNTIAEDKKDDLNKVNEIRKRNKND